MYKMYKKKTLNIHSCKHDTSNMNYRIKKKYFIFFYKNYYLIYYTFYLYNVAV